MEIGVPGGSVIGKPNNGKSFSTSRKVFQAAILPPSPLEDDEPPGGERPIGLEAILRERRHAGRFGPQQPGATAPRAAAEQPPFDRLWTLQPERKRWHRHRRILAEQRDERINVVKVEGLHIAIEQIGFVLAQVLFGRLQADAALRQRGACPLNGAVHRGLRHVQAFRRLGSRPAEHFHQQQHSPLTRRQVLDGGNEGQPDALAEDCQLVRIGISG